MDNMHVRVDMCACACVPDHVSLSLYVAVFTLAFLLGYSSRRSVYVYGVEYNKGETRV